MLRTVEATFDPARGVRLKEPIRVARPVRVLVTFMETDDQAPAIGTDKLASWLDASQDIATDRSPDEIDRYIQELRHSWE